ncbi:hypothetical protein AB0B63_06790 [Micromonospora sp. NPDC049081]|uniref:hypothetical protein n=1 Tax=Micromonospora sp. NPDC049081 TaxID=3155150 RepID=UPI0033F13856
MLDTDNLPPTQYLILEVLAARHRLGEHCWTFPSRPGIRTAVAALTVAGLVTWKSSPAQRSVLVWLTDTGRAAALDESYIPPINRTAA